MGKFFKIAEEKKENKTLDAVKDLGIGAGAGVISTALTNPIDQVANMKATFPEKYTGKTLMEVAKDIEKTHGLKGFYAGYGAKALKTAPQSALWFLAASGLGKLLKRDNN